MKVILASLLFLFPVAAMAADDLACDAGCTYPPGTAVRTIKAKLSDILNVRDFGAKCDSINVVDESQMIQNAINAATSIGQALFIPPGVCYVGTTGLTVPGNASLYLYGIGGSTLRYDGSGIGFHFGDPAIQQTNPIDIEGITFDCSHLPSNSGTTFLSGAICVFLDGINQGTFSRNTILGPLGGSTARAAYGLRIGNGAVPVNIASISETGTTVTVNTTAPHGLVAGSYVTIRNVGDAHYNGLWPVLGNNNPPPTSFQYTNPTPRLPPLGMGGTASVSVFAQRSRIDGNQIQGEFDYGIDLSNAANIGHFVLENTLINNNVLHTTNPSGTVARGSIGIHFGQSTFNNTLLGNSSGNFDIGYYIGGATTRGIGLHGEANGVEVLFQDTSGSGEATVGNDIQWDAEGNNGTLLVGPRGFAWQAGKNYNINAWRTNVRSGSLVGIYRQGNASCTSVASGAPTGSSSIAGCVNETGCVTNCCCWQYYGDQVTTVGGTPTSNSIRRSEEFNCSLMPGDQGDSTGSGGDPAAGGGTAGDCLYSAVQNGDMNMHYRAGWTTEQTVNLGVDCAFCGGPDGGDPILGTSVRVWDLSKSATAAPTTFAPTWSVIDRFTSPNVTKLTFNPGNSGTVAFGAGAQLQTTTSSVLLTAGACPGLACAVGTTFYCTDCQTQAACTGAGTGHIAVKQAGNNPWQCN